MPLFFRDRVSAGVIAAMVAGLSFASEGGLAQDRHIQVSVGDTETVQLDGNPSTGYGWVLEAVPKIVSVDVLGYAKAELQPGERPKLGAPAKFQVLVTGVQPGTATLVFNYVKGQAGAPEKTQQVAVDVVGDPPPSETEDPLDRPPEDPMENPGEQMFDNSAGE